jgi:dolichol-phosphate mannosyltransferase
MKASLAVVIPVFNEQEGIAELLTRLQASISENFLLVLVDDGSTDRSVDSILAFGLRQGIHRRIIQLSRNFGHQQALMSGLRSVCGEADRIVVLDGDLQDRPEDIPRLLERLGDTWDCVYAVRTPVTKSPILDLLTTLFYRLQQMAITFPVPRHAGTFSVFNAAVLEQICRFSEADIFFPGIRAYVGFRQSALEVQREPRRYGTSRVGLLGLIQLSSSGILGFSALPLRLVLLLGLVLFVICVALGVLVLTLRLTGVIEVMGFASLALLILAFFGLQMMCLGMVGEYLSKLFIDVKRRPEAIIKAITER